MAKLRTKIKLNNKFEEFINKSAKQELKSSVYNKNLNQSKIKILEKIKNEEFKDQRQGFYWRFAPFTLTILSVVVFVVIISSGGLIANNKNWFRGDDATQQKNDSTVISESLDTNAADSQMFIALNKEISEDNAGTGDNDTSNEIDNINTEIEQELNFLDSYEGSFNESDLDVLYY